MNKQIKQFFSITILISMLFWITNTYADVATAKTKIRNMQNSSTPSGDFWYIITNMFDAAAQKLRPEFYDEAVIKSVISDTTVNYVPRDNWTKFVNSSIFDNGKVWVWTTTPSEKLSVSGRISVTTDPNTGDDVWDRDYNDSRYQRDITGACPVWQSVKSINDDWTLVCVSGSADNLGNHRAIQNIRLDGHYLSWDWDNEWIKIENSGWAVRIGWNADGLSWKLWVNGPFIQRDWTVSLANGSGNVGIWTTNPEEKLSVNWNIIVENGNQIIFSNNW